MEPDDLDGVHNIDDGAVGGEVTNAGNHSSVSESLFDSDICRRLKLLKLNWKDLFPVFQEHGYFTEGSDRHIHLHGDVRRRPDPQSHSSSCEREINIGARKHLFPSRNGHGRAQTRFIEAEQEQEKAPSRVRAHAIVPSGSYDLFPYFTFWPPLTSFSYSSESRAVFTEMNSSTAGDAYCFGNAFVCMNALLGTTTVPILSDSAQIVNVVASADTGNGHDEDHFEDVTIPFQK